MKRIIIYIICIVAGVTGCNDLLDVKPHTFASDQTYYKTESQIKSAVNGAYDRLQRLYLTVDGTYEGIFVLTEMRADNTNFQYVEADRGGEQLENINDFLMSASNIYNQNVWNALYDGVQQANVVLDNIGAVNFEDPGLKARYEGEARFIRAFLYFHLVRLYGEVPLRQTATSNPDDAFTPRKATVEQLYTFIMEDVTYAMENLPEKYTGADVGRATFGAALTLLGEIYLTRHDYPNAILTLEKVTTLGYDLVKGANAYASLFDPNNKNNIESVFEIQYSASLSGEANNYIFNWCPHDGKLALTGFQGESGARNIPTVDMIQTYEPGDLRKDVSIAFWVDKVNRTFQESLGGNLSTVGDSVPYIKKFYHPPYTINGRSDENWPVYRYAYVKLMLADALNEDGRGSEALLLLNDVRERAGLGALTYTGQEQLRDAIFHETRVEVAFENHRWYQLLRTGRAVDVMTAHGKGEKAKIQEAATKLGQKPHLPPSAYNVEPYMLLIPIPERECRLNGFENNPGYN